MSSVCCASFPPPRASSHPVDIGTRSEGAIFSELLRRGYTVSVPFGPNQRYDLIVDLGHQLARVQCKTGRLRNGVVAFSTRSVRVNTRGAHWRDYDGEIDYFFVFCPENERVYVVPIEDAARGYGTLRVAPATNGQAKGIRWAADYELPAVGPVLDADLD